MCVTRRAVSLSLASLLLIFLQVKRVNARIMSLGLYETGCEVSTKCSVENGGDKLFLRLIIYSQLKALNNKLSFLSETSKHIRYTCCICRFLVEPFLYSCLTTLYLTFLIGVCVCIHIYVVQLTRLFLNFYHLSAFVKCYRDCFSIFMSVLDFK